MSLDIFNAVARTVMDRCIEQLDETTAWEIYDAVVANEGTSRTQIVDDMGDDQLIAHLAMEWLTYLEQNDTATADAIDDVHVAQESAYQVIESS